MILHIAKQEIVQIIRDKRFMLLLLLIIALLGLSVYVSGVKYKQLETYRSEAARQKREEWLHQDPKHPHTAAHFGNFAFKPVTPLNWIDYGVDSYTGTYVYMEPHRQNDFVFTPAQEQSGSIRFGELSPALILQVFVPMLMIFLCFSSITREKESGVLRLLNAQGITMRQLITGKITGYFFVFLAIIIPLLAGVFLGGNSQGTAIIPAEEVLARFGLLLAAYLIYFFIFIGIVVFISAVAKSSRAAMLSSLGLWILLIVFMPKATANLGADLHPLPSNEAFADAIRTDIKNGIDGHNPDDQRKKKLTDSMLKKYAVDSVSQLPVNMEGVVMEAAEDYSSAVYDKHFANVQQTLLNQNKLSSLASWLNPYIAIRNLSMSLSLTDPYSHIDFQKAAENYRRSFVQNMNEDMALRSKPGSFFTYKIDDKTYEKIPGFNYQSPSVGLSIQGVSMEATALVFCLLLIVLAIFSLSNKISVL